MKFRTMLLVSVAMCLAAPVFAASIGNSIEPLGHGKFSVGVEDSYIFEREIAPTDSLTTAEMEDINQTYAKLSVGITDYLNLYTKLGTSNLEQYFKETDGSTYDIEYDNGFLWGVGTNGSIELGKGWSLGADVQYLFWDADVDSLVYNTESALTQSGNVENSEFQAALFVSKKIQPLGTEFSIVPYVGGVYSDFTTETDDAVDFTTSSLAGQLKWDLEGDNEFGPVAGVDVACNDSLKLNVEGRFITEQAVTAGLTYRF